MHGGGELHAWRGDYMHGGTTCMKGGGQHAWGHGGNYMHGGRTTCMGRGLHAWWGVLLTYIHDGTPTPLD